MTSRIVLRTYQKKGAVSINEALSRAQRGVVYQLATGGGKTPVLGKVTEDWECDGAQVTVFTHRRELLRQVGGTLGKFGIPFGYIRPDDRMSNLTVHVASIDTVLARLKSMRGFLQAQNLAIFDEGHHIVAPKWRRLWDACSNARKLLVTATPYRADGAPIGEFADESVQGPSVKALIELGVLAEPVTYQPPINIDFSKIRRNMGDYSVSELEELMMDEDKHITDDVVRYWAERAPRRPTIVFCVTVKHAMAVARRFQKMTGKIFEAVNGETPSKERDRILAGIEDGTIDGVCAVDLISEGYDVPRAACGIFLRKTMSTQLYQQQGGRAMRFDDDFPNAMFIDVVGNSKEHGLLDELRPWTLAEGREKGEEKNVQKPIRCIGCHRVQRPSHACIECGRTQITLTTDRYSMLEDAARPSVSRVLRTASHDVIRAMSKETIEDLATTESDLRYVASVRGLSPEWVLSQLERRRRAATFEGRR